MDHVGLQVNSAESCSETALNQCKGDKQECHKDQDIETCYTSFGYDDRREHKNWWDASKV